MDKTKFKTYAKAAFRSWYWLLILIVIIDQVSKWAAVTYLSLDGPPVTIIANFFYFDLYYNTGAAWSFLEGQTVLLMIISLLGAIIMLAYRIYARNKLNQHHKAAAALITGGTIGNLIDRSITVLGNGQGVIDFLRFDFGSYRFPVFNIADAALTIGVIYLLIVILLTPDPDKKKKKEQLASADISAVELEEQKEEETDQVLPEQNENESEVANDI